MELKELFAALVRAQSMFEDVVKDTQAYNYKYSTLSGVRDAVIDALSKCGLTVIQFPVTTEDHRIGVETILAHESGQSIGKTFAVTSAKSDPQSIGSLITYLRRYSLMAVLGIAPEDDDGEAAMPTPVSKPAADPANIIVPFGKFKGTRLGEINKDQLLNYVQYLEAQPKRKDWYRIQYATGSCCQVSPDKTTLQRLLSCSLLGKSSLLL